MPGQIQQTRAIKATKLAKQKGALEVSVNWVPGHMDVKGNMEADKLTRQGAQDDPDNFLSSLASVKKKIKEIALYKWCQCHQNYCSKIPQTNSTTYSKLSQKN